MEGRNRELVTNKSMVEALFTLLVVAALDEYDRAAVDTGASATRVSRRKLHLQQPV